MPDERLPKRVLFGHMDGSGMRGKGQKIWVSSVREGLQLAPSTGMTLISQVASRPSLTSFELQSLQLAVQSTCNLQALKALGA